jgi:sulfate/thiosulfate transport system substrate-binding protein
MPDKGRKMFHRLHRGFPLFTAAISLAVIASSAGLAQAARPHDGVSLTLAAYSTPQAAYTAIIPAFQKTKAGNGVTFSTSYGASGDQSRAVKNGLQADVVAFSLEPDISALVKVGLVSSSWYKNAYHGFVTDSTVVFVVRKGNPKHIKTWNDLIKPGVQLDVPNVFDSGGARWDIMAAYGAQLKLHRTSKQAVAYLAQLYKNIVAQDKSAGASLTTFTSGKGDVLLSYENEAIAAQQKGLTVEYVVPAQSILIENPVAVTKISKHQSQAKAFVQYLYSPTAQSIFGQKGYWPVVKNVAKAFHFQKPKTLFTIRDLGSWPAVMTKFFDPANGIIAQIERGSIP